MSSSTTIGDPYLLAAYSLPPPSKKSLGKSVAPDERPFILSSHSTGSKHEDGLLTVAVQGDGIHVLDVSLLLYLCNTLNLLNVNSFQDFIQSLRIP